MVALQQLSNDPFRPIEVDILGACNFLSNKLEVLLGSISHLINTSRQSITSTTRYSKFLTNILPGLKPIESYALDPEHFTPHVCEGLWANIRFVARAWRAVAFRAHKLNFALLLPLCTRRSLQLRRQPVNIEASKSPKLYIPWAWGFGFRLSTTNPFSKYSCSP